MRHYYLFFPPSPPRSNKMTNQPILKSNEAQEAIGIRDQLVGAWELLSYVSTPPNSTKEEEATYPLGKNPRGILIYSADGYMSAQIQALELAKEEPDAHSTQVTGHLGYAGPFHIDETGTETVLQHHVSLSSFPAWLGDIQRRVARLDGDILVLSMESEIVVAVRSFFGLF